MILFALAVSSWRRTITDRHRPSFADVIHHPKSCRRGSHIYYVPVGPSRPSHPQSFQICSFTTTTPSQFTTTTSPVPGPCVEGVVESSSPISRFRFAASQPRHLHNSQRQRHTSPAPPSNSFSAIPVPVPVRDTSTQ
jgi:hypothetical protein